MFISAVENMRSFDSWVLMAFHHEKEHIIIASILNLNSC